MVDYMEALLEDARKLKKAGGTTAGIANACWLAVSEVVKELLFTKGLTKIFEHKKQGELLMRAYPSEPELFRIYAGMRDLHRETYDVGKKLPPESADRAIADAEKFLKTASKYLR